MRQDIEFDTEGVTLRGWLYVPDRAREPKRLVLLRGGHFDAYVKDFDTASGAARDWFLEHLGSRR